MQRRKPQHVIVDFAARYERAVDVVAVEKHAERWQRYGLGAFGRQGDDGAGAGEDFFRQEADVTHHQLLDIIYKATFDSRPEAETKTRSNKVGR